MAYTIEDGYMTCDQTNQNVAQTVKMTVRAPRVANRIFETLEQAQAYVNIYDNTASATPGLVLSVFNDTDDNNGIYRVVSVATKASEVGSLEKIGGDCGIQLIRIVDFDIDLRPYTDEGVYFCIVDRSSINKPSLIFVFEINDSGQQILWGNNGYYQRQYNSVSESWGPWKWYGYVDAYHTHVSADITDSVTTLPASADDKDKLVQAGAVERYVSKMQSDKNIPTVDHKLIYSEDNETLIAKEFILPRVYVVDSDEEEEACKSEVPALTDTSNALKAWRAYSNSQNMPEYGGGISFEPNTYTPVGYHQGYKKWSKNETVGYLRTDNVAQDLNGYINIDASSVVNFEVVVGFEDGDSSHFMPEGSGATPQRAVCLMANGATARKVTINGTDYYRDTMYDIPLSQRTGSNDWRAWAHKTSDCVDVVFGGSDEINEVSGGTKVFTAPELTPLYTIDEFPKATTGNTIDVQHITATGTTSETIANPTIATGETTGSLSMLALSFDNRNFDTIGATVSKVDVNGKKSRFIGGAYCPASNDQGAITLLHNAGENIASGDTEFLLVPGTAESRSIVDYKSGGDASSMASFIKAHITAENGVVTVEYTDVVICDTDAIETILGSAANWSYNGSSLVIDFNEKKMITTNAHSTPATKVTGETSFAESTFDFTPFLGDLNVMYLSIGTRGSVFMSTKSAQNMNLILNVTDNTITEFDEDLWDYVTSSGTTISDLIDIMHGSHMAYNDITSRLWYSNGYEIYEILAGGKVAHEYHPDESLIEADAVTIALGGIAAGTHAKALDGKTVSQVFDMLLFPTYIAKLVSGNGPTLRDQNVAISGTYEVGFPVSGITLSRTLGDAPKAVAGNNTVQCTIIDGTVPSFTQSELNTVGTITKTFTVTYGNSTDKIKDSKGEDCPYVHPTSSSYLRADAEAATGSVLAQLKANVDSGTGCLKHNSRSATYTANILYNYYAKTISNSGGEDIDTGGTQANPTTDLGVYRNSAVRTTLDEFEFTTTFNEVEGDRVSFLLPTSFAEVKLLPFNGIAGKYPNDDEAATVANTQLVETKFYLKNVYGIITQYTKYTYNATKANANKYKVKFNKA